MMVLMMAAMMVLMMAAMMAAMMGRSAATGGMVEEVAVAGAVVLALAGGVTEGVEGFAIDAAAAVASGS